MSQLGPAAFNFPWIHRAGDIAMCRVYDAQGCHSGLCSFSSCLYFQQESVQGQNVPAAPGMVLSQRETIEEAISGTLQFNIWMFSNCFRRTGSFTLNYSDPSGWSLFYALSPVCRLPTLTGVCQSPAPGQYDSEGIWGCDLRGPR